MLSDVCPVHDEFELYTVASEANWKDWGGVNFSKILTSQKKIGYGYVLRCKKSEGLSLTPPPTPRVPTPTCMITFPVMLF